MNMRFKVVPPVRSISFIREAHRTLPLVPSSENDCCALLMNHGIDSRDEAREWITFLRALRLVAEENGRFYQCRVDPSDRELASAFRERMHAANELLALVAEAESPLTAAEVFERSQQEIIPQWERYQQDWEKIWRERVRRLLAWGCEFDLLRLRDEGYVGG